MKDNSKTNLAQNILIGALSALLIAVGALYVVEKKKNIEQTAINIDLNTEKERLEGRLQDMVDEYELIKTDNQKINQELLGEKERVKELLEKLRAERNYSYSKIAEYEKELGTMRKIMRSYIVQIDSLNQSNIALRTENRTVKRRMQAIESEREEISKKYEEASEQVGLAKVLRPYNIKATGLNRRGKEVARARNVEKVQVCFTLDKNPIAPAGNRYMYVALTLADGQVVATPEGGEIEVDGQLAAYSARREVDYQNESLDVCVFIDIAGELPAGLHRVDIYSEGERLADAAVAFK